MQTYHLFLKLVKRNLPSVMVYFIVFIVIAILAGSNVQENTEKIYQDEAIPFTVLNRDGSSLGEAMKEYLSRKNNYVEEEDNLEILQNAMFYREIYYVLIIPEGFEQSLLNGQEISLLNYKVHDSAMGYYMDLAVESWLSVLRAYLKSGMELKEAIEQTGLALETEAGVTVRQKSEESRETAYYYFQYLPYIFLSMLTNALGSILLAFNNERVRLRTACSSLSFFKRNLQIAFGTGVFGAAVWLVFEIMAVVMYRKESSVFTYTAAGINSFCFVLLTVGLSVMCGFLAKKPSVLSAIAIVVSLGSCFLGGVFVPLEILGDGILKIAKLMPTYWYVTVNDAIVKAEGFSSEAFRTAWLGMGMQLLFAGVFFSIAMAASKRRNMK